MESFISSSKNQRIKDIKKLNETKYRNKTNKFLVEGKKCVEEALKIDGLCIELLLLEDEIDIYFDLVQKTPNVTYVSNEILSYLTSTVTPQNIICVCNKEKLAINKEKGFIIALDGISDPGNLGAIIRTADAVDASEVVLLNDCVDFLNPKVIRASMGSVFHLPIRKADKTALASLKENDYKILGADIRGTEDFSFNSDAICLIIGNEAHGISDELINQLDQRIRIPIYGKAESLNAAVAASILMYKVKGF